MNREDVKELHYITDARDETYALTEKIKRVESRIDERVAALYGLDGVDAKPATATHTAQKKD